MAGKWEAVEEVERLIGVAVDRGSSREMAMGCAMRAVKIIARKGLRVVGDLEEGKARKCARPKAVMGVAGEKGHCRKCGVEYAKGSMVASVEGQGSVHVKCRDYWG